MESTENENRCNKPESRCLQHCPALVHCAKTIELIGFIVVGLQLVVASDLQHCKDSWP